MTTKWMAYYYETPGWPRPCRYEAFCFEPGHPRKAHGSGDTAEDALSDLQHNISELLRRSVLVTVNHEN